MCVYDNVKPVFLEIAVKSLTSLSLSLKFSREHFHVMVRIRPDYDDSEVNTVI